MKKQAYLLGLIATLCAVPFTACGKKGSAEKAGEKVDEAGEKAKDAVTPDGPVENAGEKVDKAVEDAKH